MNANLLALADNLDRMPKGKTVTVAGIEITRTGADAYRVSPVAPAGRILCMIEVVDYVGSVSSEVVA